MYATEPADLQPQSPHCCSKASQILKQLPASLQTLIGKKPQQLVRKEAVKFCWYRPGLGFSRATHDH